MYPCAKEDPQDSWEIYVNRNTASIDQKKKITKRKEIIGLPEILLTGMGQEPRELRAQWGELRATEISSQALKPKKVCPDEFQNFFELKTPFSFLSLPPI